jgi:hypothetical protein
MAITSSCAVAARRTISVWFHTCICSHADLLELQAAWDLPAEEDKGQAELEAAKTTLDEAGKEGKIQAKSFVSSLIEVRVQCRARKQM